MSASAVSEVRSCGLIEAGYCDVSKQPDIDTIGPDCENVGSSGGACYAGVWTETKGVWVAESVIPSPWV